MTEATIQEPHATHFTPETLETTIEQADPSGPTDIREEIHQDTITFQHVASRLAEIVSEDLCQGGILSQSLPGYEERPAQIEMASIVARSLTQNTPAIIEAATGVGKSLAYLVPIVRSGKVAIISTANKALQEQLFYKDIPFVQQHIKHFDAALVKGIGNYVCIDRLENERTGMQFYAKNRDFTRLVDITNDPEAKFNGDFETLDFQLSGDIRGKVCGDSDQCAWRKCNYFSDCYVREMRENAEQAQIIVVNHTLLLLDAAMDGFFLPERDVIVLDEAHHLEEEATRSFTITISENSVLTLLAQKLLKNHTLLSLQDEAEKALLNTWDRLNLVADLGFKGRANLQSPVEEGLKLATIITELADSLRKQRPKDLPDKEGLLYDKLLKRTQNLAQNIRIVFSVDQPSKFVYYVERVARQGQRGFQLQVSAAPLDVAVWLKEKLFDKCNVICTSATLATIGPNSTNPEDKGPNFAYFRRRTGLDLLENPDIIERILPL
ncbi:MAG TPA: ATP-dependent DNA helicase, partial [Ktedonobacteraceae bacterium]